ncbi:hypothetical protein WICPIJ_006234 [Wickerhamomyces pijperi]|uniref:Uncharacterized protein n=1 Tax=Wickerhamomyces pijperi TaxID=599730 RepID=A0A9P8TL70_WICPI|nr:hypothetical protein WICPIJ_006234 [Wickerhamomyces pijperi]
MFLLSLTIKAGASVTLLGNLFPLGPLALDFLTSEGPEEVDATTVDSSVGSSLVPLVISSCDSFVGLRALGKTAPGLTIPGKANNPFKFCLNAVLFSSAGIGVGLDLLWVEEAEEVEEEEPPPLPLPPMEF